MKSAAEMFFDAASWAHQTMMLFVTPLGECQRRGLVM
jgi:hypothetical protein